MNSYSPKLIPVIMAGGSGTRLWPLSRSGHPKQFLSLIGSQTMLQQTVARLCGLNVELPTVICNEEHRFFAAEQLRQIDSLGPIILEPVGKNTAPAIALAALLNQDPNVLMLVLSADHVIKDEQAFVNAVEKAVPLAVEGRIVTFGVKPTSPATGYGYIKVGRPLSCGYEVDEFKEKPDSKTAQSYLSAGNYFWNSGIFLTRVDTYLSELEKYRPDISSACKSSMAHLKRDYDFIRPDKKYFANSPSESIDYAIMEKTGVAAVVDTECEWSDVGSWSSLWEVSSRDAYGNAVTGDALLLKSKNNLVRADDKLVAAVGVENLVIVSTKDAVFVSEKDKSQDVKDIVAQLQTHDRSERELHREVYRPWGKYDSVGQGECYQVKRITVNPGAKLSLQMHHHRAEHWVVVSGVAKVTLSDEIFLLQENESTYIPIGEVHSLENPGTQPLEIIEIQSGSYLSEDDIVRIEDRYGRK